MYSAGRPPVCLILVAATAVTVSQAIIVVPQLPTAIFSGPYYTLPSLLAKGPVETYLTPNAGPIFTPLKTSFRTVIDNLKPAEYSSRLRKRNLDLCYFLSNDIHSSHVACNPRWADGTLAGVNRYLNELTFEANRVLGTNNLKLVWKGPYVTSRIGGSSYPAYPAEDTVSVSSKGCDAVVFMVFNQFAKDCKTPTTGHKYAGINKGGMCEAAKGSGYTIIVDQGFLDDTWTGPQILAHHLLKMLIADLPDSEKTCPNRGSLLFGQLIPGKQRVDQCVVNKLNRSRVSLRKCMQD